MDKEQVSHVVYLHRAIEGIENIFRLNRDLAKLIIDRISDYVNKLKQLHGSNTRIKIMNFCGTHEWTVTHFGIRSLVPSSIELIAGPGCPVCVTPSYYIEEVIRLALDKVVVYTYGDTYRLRAIHPVKDVRSLSEARAYGAEVKIVTGLAEAIADAKSHKKDSVFVGIGFETVASGYAKAILSNVISQNLKILSLVKLTPPAMVYTLEVHKKELPVNGVIAPGHVSTIIGAKAWKRVSNDYKVPVVVSGFEPIDVMLSLLEIVKQLTEGRSETVIEYKRAATWDGDLIAQRMIEEVFDVVDDAWRGIGIIPLSGLRLKNKYKIYDGFYEYSIKELNLSNWVYDLSPGCKCSDIVLGKAIPTKCPLFMKVCTPATPIGPCMVSIEGTCSIWAKYGGSGLASEIAKELNL
ncbi:MAG: hydrogenase formation protein HypD [Ignisphaera sp.]|uniref:Hydrogenase formation protein HypD n=1 Tax=Ignisphaera aggregans TaxID=334771 RepID=A0A7C4JJN3_9CREN